MSIFKARVEYEVTDASVKTYSFPFPYLRKEFIKVSILHTDNSVTALTYGVDYSVDDLTITLVTAPSVSEHLIIYRETTTDKIITWNDGSILLAKDMNTEDAQMLHLQEEQKDYLIANALATSVTDTKETIWSAQNHRVTDVSDPKEPQDAVTKHYMESVQDGFVSRNTSLLEQTTTQATNAKNSASSSATSASQSASSASASETSNQSAKKWAESTDSPDNQADTDSTTGKTQSSRSWALYSKVKAQEAATSAQKAYASESNAQTYKASANTSATEAYASERNAKTSETNAKASATNAKTSETNAKASEVKASASEANAKTSETHAKDFATNASTSQAHAIDSENNAKDSETKAATSEAHAKTSETNAKTSEANAKISETNAKASEANAKISETNAKTSEDNSRNYADSAYTSASKAQAWAESEASPDGEDDSLSTTGKTRSARGWAMQAKDFAGSLNLSFILDTLLPVGTIYMTEDASFNPNTSWGVGTWEKTAINRVLQGTNDTSKVGTTVKAGLPNIKGQAKFRTISTKDNDILLDSTGSFHKTTQAWSGEHDAFANKSYTPYKMELLNLDASRSNSIYGSSNTVQPPAELVFIWKRTA